jgi:hypothetical protein
VSDIRVDLLPAARNKALSTVRWLKIFSDNKMAEVEFAITLLSWESSSQATGSCILIYSTFSKTGTRIIYDSPRAALRPIPD